MFRGLHDTTIDSKGRARMPARLRESLAVQNGVSLSSNVTSEGTSDENVEESLVVTTGIDKCLVVYPVPEWTAFEAKLASLPRFDQAVVRLKRIYVAGAIECTLDKHGRLMIPAMLREYAGIERDIVWAGMVNTAEIWSKEVWTLQAETSRADKEGIARALTELGL